MGITFIATVREQDSYRDILLSTEGEERDIHVGLSIGANRKHTQAFRLSLRHGAQRQDAFWDKSVWTGLQQSCREVP